MFVQLLFDQVFFCFARRTGRFGGHQLSSQWPL